MWTGTLETRYKATTNKSICNVSVKVRIVWVNLNPFYLSSKCSEKKSYHGNCVHWLKSSFEMLEFLFIRMMYLTIKFHTAIKKCSVHSERFVNNLPRTFMWIKHFFFSSQFHLHEPFLKCNCRIFFILCSSDLSYFVWFIRYGLYD